MRKVRAGLVASIWILGGCSSAPVEQAPVTPPAAPAPPYVLPQVEGITALQDENPDPNVVEVTLSAGVATTTFKEGTTTDVLAYNGVLPGPVLRAKVGDEVIVHFKNDLAEATTVHWHGLRISDQMDGSPRVQDPVKAGQDFTYRFKVPDAGSYWYHPHVRTDVQVEKGLYGPIVVFDPKDPTYDAERFLVLDDVRLESNGKISPVSSMDGMMGGRFGNVLLTNGQPVKLARATAKQGTVERWRIVNTANARTMIVGVDGASFRVIGTDGGLIPEPYLADRVTVAIGQRFDLEVTYDRPGTAKLVSYVETVDSKNKVSITPFDAFTVEVAPSDKSPRVIAWPAVRLTDRERVADTTATFTLDAARQGNMAWSINGKAMPAEPLFTWQQGSTVELTIVNKVATEHPFHLHGQFFEILDPDQPGLKDVVLIPPNRTMKVRAYLDNPGRWMAHCHILEHAEMGMMAEFVVVPKEGAAAPSQPPRGK